MPTISFVIPCYNEEKVLPTSGKLICEKMSALIGAGEIADNSFVLFVDDGSKDATWACIAHLQQTFKFVHGISFSRNRGHQNALLAGLTEVSTRCDAAISLDCDGQDDINAIDEMIRNYKNGSEIVYGVRNSRKKDTFFKRFTAQSFYKLLSWLGVEIVYNHADYRLASSKVLAALRGFKEVNLFLRGMFPLIGFKSSIVYYERKERMDGYSHYPLLKMLSFAFDGITSMSIRPIRFIAVAGVGFCLISLVAFSLMLFVRDESMIIWLCIACSAITMGVVLLALGLVGEYVGKIYLEVKARPRYVIRDQI